MYPVGQILAQAATALSEAPHVALLIKAHAVSILESALHSILTIRGQLFRCAEQRMVPN